MVGKRTENGLNDKKLRRKALKIEIKFNGKEEKLTRNMKKGSKMIKNLKKKMSKNCKKSIVNRQKM